MTYFELVGKVVHITACFVVMLCIAPYAADLLRELVPGLKVSYSSWWRTTMYAFRQLEDTLYRHRVLDHLVVIFKLAAWQISERREDLKTAVALALLLFRPWRKSERTHLQCNAADSSRSSAALPADPFPQS